MRELWKTRRRTVAVLGLLALLVFAGTAWALTTVSLRVSGPAGISVGTAGTTQFSVNGNTGAVISENDVSADNVGGPDRVVIFEDFLDNTASATSATTWNYTHPSLFATSSNTTFAPAGGLNGTVTWADTAATTGYTYAKGQAGAWSTTAGLGCEFRVKVNDITNLELRMGFDSGTTSFGNDGVEFVFDSAGAGVQTTPNICLYTRNNGATAVVTDTGIDLANNVYHTYRIEVSPTRQVTARIDGVRVAAAHAGTLAAGTALVPYLYRDNQAQAVQRTLTIDFVRFWANRIAN